MADIKNSIAPETYRTAVENAPIHIILTDEKGIVTYANQAVTKITGFTPEEIIGQTPSLWGKQMNPDFYQLFWKTISTDKKLFEGRLVNKRKNGERYIAYARVAPVLDSHNNIQGYVGIEQDITQQIESEEALKLFRTLLDQSNDIIIFIELKTGRIIDCNQTTSDILGYSREQLLNFQIDDLMTTLTDAGESLSDGVSWRDALTKQTTAIIRSSLKRNNDSPLPSELNFSIAEFKDRDFTVAMIRAVDQQRDQYAVAVARDISERETLERERREFLSIAAHQIRGPLGAMRWNIELLGGQELKPDQRLIINQLVESNTHMLTLINELLNVSRIDMLRVQDNPVTTNIAHIIGKVIAEQAPTAHNKDITINFKHDPDPFPNITIDEKRLREVIENITNNAIKYSLENSTVEIVLLNNAEGFHLTVTDHGIGIPQEEQASLFKKFYRASNAILHETQGSGLGLYVVKSFIEDWGGQVALTSTQGKGTSITINLPPNPTAQYLNQQATSPQIDKA